jgi:uncharacterized membrane protein
MKKNILFITLAIVLGFASLTLFTAIAQEVIYDGISLTNSPLPTLIIGGGLSVLSAVLAGCVARLVFSPYKIIVPVFISLFIVADTTIIIVNDVTVDPAWFDLLAGGSLIIGIWVGYYYTQNVRQYFRKFS